MNKRYKLVTPIAWGGSDDNETLADILWAIAKTAPTSVTRCLELYSSGGWPVYEIVTDERDLDALCELMDLEREDFIAAE